MTLIEDWKKVLRKAWSMRLMLAATVLSALEVALPYVAPYVAAKVPAGLFAALSALIIVAAAVARLVQQQSMKE